MCASSGVSNAGTTYYIGNYYEVYKPDSGTTTFNRYYYFGAQRVAAKIAETLFYFQGDHLGSSSVVMTQAGTSFYTRQTYFPYGAQRTTEGSVLPTDYTFTGQKNDDSTGLMFYGARYYDTSLGRFIQADTIVPSPLNPQSLNRFSYTLNNPVKYTDPTGHAEVCDDPSCGANPPSNPSNNGEVPTTPTAPPANPPVNAPTNPNPEQGDDCKRHCDDADRADGSPSSPTRSPKAEFRGKCLGYCTGDGEEEKRGGPIGNGTGEAGNGTAGGGCAGVSGWWLYGCSDYNPWRVRWEKGINEARVNSQGLSQVQINQRVGNAFRDEVANYYRGQGFNVETEQTILTKWGPRRLDVVIKNGSGDTLLAVETKVGGASYGPIQRIKDDIITQELGFQVQPYWNWYNSPPPIVP